jgi:hypothetical protein
MKIKLYSTPLIFINEPLNVLRIHNHAFVAKNKVIFFQIMKKKKILKIKKKMISWQIKRADLCMRATALRQTFFFGLTGQGRRILKKFYKLHFVVRAGVILFCPCDTCTYARFYIYLYVKKGLA